MTASRDESQPRVELDIGGMTCASCAARIERKLNKLDGVVATVNYATEKARVTYPENVTTDDLVAHRRADRLHRRRCPGRPPGRRRRAAADAAPVDDPAGLDAALQRLLVSAALTVPVIAMAMVPALQFDDWQWLSLTLAAPVVVWGGVAVPPGRLAPTCGTAPPRWTPWSRSARSPRSAGRSRRCSSGTAGDAGHDPSRSS